LLPFRKLEISEVQEALGFVLFDSDFLHDLIASPSNQLSFHPPPPEAWPPYSYVKPTMTKPRRYLRYSEFIIVFTPMMASRRFIVVRNGPFSSFVYMVFSYIFLPKLV